MQTYQSTPDYYRDYIEHGWLKDQAAKVHKYIKRWRNDAGKWVYKYATDARTKINRWNTANREFGFGNTPVYEWKADKPKKKNADMITTNYGKKALHKHDSGRADYRSGRVGSTESGIDAGRIRSGRYIKGFSKRPGSRKRTIIYGRHTNTQKGRSVTDMQDELAYIRLRNKIAAYNARKNRRAK